MRASLKRYWPVTLIALWLLCISCETAVEKPARYFGAHTGQVTIFFSGEAERAFNLTFQLLSLAVETQDGHRTVLINTAQPIDSTRVVGTQILLHEGALEPGRYEKIILQVSDAMMEKAGEKATLVISEPEVVVPFSFRVASKQNTSLFINWNLERSVEAGYMFKPFFTVRGRMPQLPSQKLYITNEDSDNVSVVNRFTYEIMDVVKVGRSPRGIALSKDRRQVFVANFGSDSISVIDTTTNQLLDTIRLPLSSQPQDVDLTPDGKLLIVCNFAGDSVTIFDGLTFNRLVDVPVGQGPVKVKSHPRAAQVYVVNHLSDSVSVINTSTLLVEATLKTESRPTDIEFSSRSNVFFVTNKSSPNILVFQDRSNRLKDRINVGRGAVALVESRFGQRLLVVREMPDQVLLVDPGTKVVTNFIDVGKEPTNIALDPDERKAFVANHTSHTISVVDEIIKKQVKIFSVGRAPYDLVALE